MIKYLILILIISFIVVLVLDAYYDTINKIKSISFYDKKQIGTFLKTDKNAIEYINSIDKKTIKYKIKNSKNLNDYYKAFNDFTKDDKEKIIYQIEHLPKNNLLKNFKWNFAKTDTKLEMAMPYTLQDIIFTPTNMLDSLNNNVYNKDIAFVLCHESIHVLQRQYPHNFDKFIKDKLKFYKLQIFGKKPLVEFVNPDGPQQKNNYSWCFEIKNVIYCPFLQLNDDGTLSKTAVKLTKNKDKYYFTNNTEDVATLLQKRFPNCPISQLYHPNEILAEMGAKYIMYGKSGNSKIDKFYNNFYK